MNIRAKLEAALAKRSPEIHEDIGDPEYFDPWEDVIHGIYGNYASESDDLMLDALKAVRDKTTGEVMERRGFAGEFALYILAGHGLLEYGTSPRFGWPDPKVADLWQSLIEKWEAYAAVQWRPIPP